MTILRRCLSSLSLLLFVQVSSVTTAFAEDERPPALNCEVGPLTRAYGEGPWIVYACDDKRSVVIAADQGNPAQPFFFILYVKPDGEMRLYGEGTGDKTATQAAFDELAKLRQADVAALVEAATRSAGVRTDSR